MERNSWQPGEDEEKLENIKEVFKEQGFDLDNSEQQISRVGFHTGYIKDENGEIQYTKPLLNARFKPETENLDKLQEFVDFLKPQTEHDIKVRKRKIGKQALRSMFVFGDVHIGYRRINEELVSTHDEKAMAVALEIMKDIQPDLIVNLGDFMDFAEFGRYDADSNHFAATTQLSLDRGFQYMSDIRESVPNAKIIELQGNHDCFDDKTEVLTDQGWMKYDQAMGRKIASFNIDTNVIEFDEPIAFHTYDYDGELNRIVNGGIDLLITDNHRLVYKPNYLSKEYKIEEFSKINKGNPKRILPVNGDNNKIDYDISDDEIKLIGWAITDCYISPKYNNAEFTQRESNAHKIQDLLDQMNISYRKRIRDRQIGFISGKKVKTQELSVEFHLRSKETKSLKNLLSTDDFHDIPSYVKDFSKRQFDLLLETIVDADGTVKGGTYIVYKSKKFLDQLQALCIQNGYRANIKEYRENHFRLSVSSGQTREYSPRTDTHKEAYNGVIWCATTKNDTIVVRRNGRVVITGNSRIQKLLAKVAKDLLGLRVAGTDKEEVFSYEHLMGYDRIDVDYISGYPVGAFEYSDKLQFRHGSELKSGGSTAHKMSQAYPFTSVIQGHGHKSQMHKKTNRDGTVDTYIMNGMLGKITGEIPGYGTAIDDWGRVAKKQEDWQQGVVVVHDHGDDKFEFNQIDIEDGEAYYQGKRYRAE